MPGPTAHAELNKLRIEVHDKPDYSDGAVATFDAYVNPGEITLNYEVEYNSGQGQGTTNSRMDFSRVKPGDMSLALLVDGTGANGVKIDVQKKIEEFQKVTLYHGDIHRTTYLKIAWGSMQIYRCVLKSASIVYKLFRPDGVPLRAIINAVFSGNADDKTRVAIAQDQSPDLTHVRIVKAGDNLPSLCYGIYGDPWYYLDVARANRIDDFRNLIPGTRLFFPPLEK